MEAFKYTFMINAFLAGLMISILCSVISFFIVTRKISFIGVSIAHSAFGGIAIGTFFGFFPLLSALIFAVISGIIIVTLVEKKKVQEDSLIGILFSFSMALGIVLISLKKEYTGNLLGYLFGNILSVTRTDLIIFIILTSVIISCIAIFFREFLLLSFDESYGYVLGIPMKFYNYFLTTIIAVTIIISMKLVGIIMISALLVIPASSALLVFKDYKKVIPFSILFSILIITTGLWLSFYIKVPSSGLIVILYTIFFVICWGYSKLKRKWGQSTNSLA